jgi:hypothetical protein
MQTYTAQITQRAANAIMDAITIWTDTLGKDPRREPPTQSLWLLPSESPTTNPRLYWITRPLFEGSYLCIAI